MGTYPATPEVELVYEGEQEYVVAQHFNWRCDSYFLPGYFSKIENFET
jgi:hypothetical protein